MKLKPRTAEIIRTSYQPTKAELEEKIVLDVPGETVMERMGSLGKAVLRPIKPRWIKKPGSRR